MSIADKISRLSVAKTNIASAITIKGGTVSAGDGFEDFATDIATIPSGGGIEYATGLYTPASNSNRIPITHNLGTKKVLVTIDAVTDSSNRANFTGNYQAITVFAVYRPALFNETTYVDYSSYHPSLTTKDIDQSQLLAGGVYFGGEIVSPYTSQSTDVVHFGIGNATTFSGITDDYFQFCANHPFAAGVTYRWTVYSLETEA